MRLDTATVYQIFWLSYSGIPKAEIARQLGLARNTVAWHLTGRLIPQYPPRLRQRISPINVSRSRSREIPDGMITISEASYCFPNRPTVRTLLAHYGMRTEIIKGATYTTLEWAKQYSAARFPNPPLGVCMTAKAMATLYGPSKMPKRKIIRLSDLETNDTPASIVHAAVSIMRWTKLDFVTLDELDVLRLS